MIDVELEETRVCRAPLVPRGRVTYPHQRGVRFLRKFTSRWQCRRRIMTRDIIWQRTEYRVVKNAQLRTIGKVYAMSNVARYILPAVVHMLPKGALFLICSSRHLILNSQHKISGSHGGRVVRNQSGVHPNANRCRRLMNMECALHSTSWSGAQLSETGPLRL